MLKPHKFLIYTVVREEDEDGDATGERTNSEPVVVYGLKGLRAFTRKFAKDLARLNEDEAGTR